MGDEEASGESGCLGKSVEGFGDPSMGRGRPVGEDVTEDESAVVWESVLVEEGRNGTPEARGVDGLELEGDLARCSSEEAHPGGPPPEPDDAD